MIMSRRRAVVLGVAAAVAAPLLFTAAPATAAADGCEAGFAIDFNGDGLSDTVVADPYATVGGAAQAGRVIVLYGDADGRIGEGARGMVSRAAAASVTPRRPGTGSASPSRWPTSTATSTPTWWSAARTRTSAARPTAGYVQIIWGGPGGLGAGGRIPELTQTTSPTPTSRRRPVRLRGRCPGGRRPGRHPEPDAYALAIGAAGLQHRRGQRRGLGRLDSRLRRRERRRLRSPRTPRASRVRPRPATGSAPRLDQLPGRRRTASCRRGGRRPRTRTSARWPTRGR